MELIRLSNLRTSNLYHLEKVVFIEGSGNYSRLQLESGETTEYYCIQLGQLEKTLNEDFCRIDRSTIINLSYVKSYSNSRPVNITMTNNRICRVSIRRSKAFKEKMSQKYLF